eukprot:Nitzschia sp. Nitz4//scaffold13_size275219//227931//228857//NITZ4_000914-RA/size275219-processed-gene-0.164-mRNA-1//-1//CDS//3329536134//2828//frame0
MNSRHLKAYLFGWSLLLTIVSCLASSSTSSAAFYRPSSDELSAVLEERFDKAQKLAALEQEIEDHSAAWVASSSDIAESTSKRRLICLPLDDRFDPPMGVFSHGHVQTGDKMSLPRVFLQAIQTNKAEVPWLFTVRRVEKSTREGEEEVTSSYNERVVGPEPAGSLSQVIGGPLDFRAPPNYVFLPHWMMRALGLQPRDVVDVEITFSVPAGSLARLRPHSFSWSKEISNPQAVLETELRHYSSLTKGSTIAFDYNSKRYWFDVEDLRSAPRGERCSAIRVQDCDIATDFLPAKDTKRAKARKTKADE